MPEVVDPTLNVIALNEASAKRQDDLRQMESAYLKEIMELRQAYVRDLMKAESARIDALRQNDVQALAFANERQQNEAMRLADQTRQSLDDIRKQIGELQRVQSTTTGTSGGKKDLWILIMGGVLFALNIAGFIINLVNH